jgi:hypothetical protein
MGVGRINDFYSGEYSGTGDSDVIKGRKIRFQRGQGTRQQPFANSVVKNRFGGLKTVFHGSPTPVIGDYKTYSMFTDSKYVAASYAGSLGTKGTVHSVQLGITDPLTISKEVMHEAYKGDELHDGIMANFESYPEMGLGEVTGGYFAPLIRYAENEGYDGIVLKDGALNGGRVSDAYIVFSPEQVRSQKDEPNPAGKQINSLSGSVQELLQDSQLALKRWQDEVRGIGVNIREFENAYDKENLSHGVIKATLEKFEGEQGKNLITTLTDFTTKGTLTPEEANMYIAAVHAPERNRYFQEKKGGSREDYSGVTEMQKAYVSTLKDGAQKAIVSAMSPNVFAEYYVAEIEKRTGKKTAKALQKAVREATDFTLSVLYDGGLLSKAQLTELTKRWNNYVPLRGWAETDEFDYTTHFGTSQKAIIRAKGRKSMADNPFSHILNMVNTAVVMSERNKVKQATAALVANNKEALKDYVWYKNTYFVDTGDKDTEGNPIIYETLDRPEQKLWDDKKVTTKLPPQDYKRHVTSGQAKEREVEFYENGEKKYLIFHNVDPAVARALSGVRGTDVTSSFNTWVNTPIWSYKEKTIIPSVGSATRFLSSVMTSRNPAFVLPNMARDIPLAIMSEWIHGSTADAMAMIPALRDAQAVIWRDVVGKKKVSGETERYYKEFKESGAETGYVHQVSAEEYKKRLEKEIRRAARKGGADATRKMQDAWKAGLNALDSLSEWSENTTRFAVYLVHRRKGDSVDKAALASKNASVNFNRKGRATPAVNGLFAFFNAGVQAGDMYFKLWGSNWKKMAAAHSFLVLQGFLSAMLMDLFGGEDDEGTRNYDKISEYTRHNSLVVPLPGTNKAATIPMPHVLRVMHGIGVSAYDMMTGRVSFGHAVKETLGSIPADVVPIDMGGMFTRDGSISPKPLIPTVVKPVYELMINENFMGYDIVPEPYSKAQENKADFRRHRDDVSTASSWLTEKAYRIGGGDDTGLKHVVKDGKMTEIPPLLDVSPETIDYLVGAYTGGLGKFALNVMTTSSGVFSAGKELMIGSDFDEAIKEIKTNRIPVVRRFLRNPNGDPMVRRYYELRNEMQQWTETQRLLSSDLLNPASVQKYNDNWESVGLPLNSFNATMGVVDKLDELVEQAHFAGDEAGASALEKEKRAAMIRAIKENEKYRQND